MKPAEQTGNWSCEVKPCLDPRHLVTRNREWLGQRLDQRGEGGRSARTGVMSLKTIPLGKVGDVAH